MFEYQFELSGREYTLPRSHGEARDFLKPCIECGDMDTISCCQHGFVHGLIRLLFHGVRVSQNGVISSSEKGGSQSKWWDEDLRFLVLAAKSRLSVEISPPYQCTCRIYWVSHEFLRGHGRTKHFLTSSLSFI